MLKRISGVRNWHAIRKKIEVHSPIAMEVYAASDLNGKQWPEETLQEYIQNFTDLTDKAMGVDLGYIMNRVIIFQFIKNFYNKDIRRVASANVIHTLADTFK